MDRIVIGTSALPNASVALIKEAGISWLRQDFPFPFADHMGGHLTEEYLKAKATAKAWAEQGLNLMGVSPMPGIGGYKPDAAGKMQFVWQDWFPGWMGSPAGDGQLFRNYHQVCAFLAHDLRGIVQMWQIANELDIELFAGPLNPRQAAELILQGALGFKSTDPTLIVGPNTAGAPPAYYLYG
ncbi:MAG: hypothetical protein M1546_15790, partial [Chloroflexi bacterium]|nr:hypothetical protein [Chloroflexota bacterium]